MKKTIIFLTFLLFIAGMFGVEVIIGTGTTYNTYSSYPAVYGGYYMNAREQYIVTPAEFAANGGGAGNITSIAFNVNSVNGCGPLPNFTIRMGTTTQTAFTTTTFITGLSQVYNVASYQPVAGWNTHTFDSAFNWDGTSNVVIEVSFDFQDDWTENTSTYYTSTSDYKAMYYRNDSTAWNTVTTGTQSYNRPNMKFNMAAGSTMAPFPALLVSPANGASMLPLNTTLNWASGGGNPTGYRLYFGTTTPPLLYDDLGNVTTFSPVLDYETTYYWQIVPYNSEGDAQNCPIWSFSTTPEVMILIGTGTSSQRQPFGIWYGYERSAALYTNAQIGGYGIVDKIGWNCATANPSPVPYNIYVMQTTDTALTAMTWDAFTANATLVDTGTHIFNYTGWHLLELDNPFTYSFGNLVIGVETNYGGGGTSPYPYFYYTAGTASRHQYWNADNNPPTANGYLNAYVPNIVLHLGALSEEPVFNVSPASWDFGQVQINTIKTKNFTISNIGGGTISVSSIIIAGDDYYTLTTNPAPVDLTAGQPAIFTVQYAPTATGIHNGTVTITDNRGTTIVDLSAVCYDPTIYTFPYTQDFEIWPPEGWDLTGGTYSFTQYPPEASSNHWAKANFWSQSSGNTDILTSPPLQPVNTPRMSFTWSHLYSSTYPNDALTVQISSNLTNWTNLWTKSGADLNSNDGATNTAPGTGVVEIVNIPADYANTTFWIRFYAYSGWGPDLFIDNVVIYIPSSDPFPVTLTYPADGENLLPATGFDLEWEPDLINGAQPEYYAVYLSQEGEDQDLFFSTEFRFETENTHFNPVTEGEMTFNYNERWFWTVEAFIGSVSAYVWPPYMFNITPQPGILGVNPPSLTQTLTLPDQITATQQLTLSNTGELPLNYRILIEETTDRRSSIIPSEQMTVPILNPEAGNYTENAPVQGAVIEPQSRILFDLQFYYPTQVNDGEYAIVCDDNYFYVSVWSAASFHKYDLSGNFLETFSVTGVSAGLRDLTYDGTYFYGAAAATTIYQMDFNTHTLIGTITAPSSVRGIAYDENNDAFWVTSNWSSPLYLVSRTGTTLQTLTTAATSMGGLAWDNLSGPEPTLWANTQTGTNLNTLVQIDLNDGHILQSFNVDATVVPGLPTSGYSAGGLCIAKNLIPGTASLVAMAQNYAFYGLELCTIITWLNAEPATGTINPGETPAVTVSFDASNLDVGTYSANLTFTHNGENEPIVVPVTLTVGGIYPAVFSITPDVSVDFGTIEQLNSVVKTFTITNTGGSSPVPLTISAGDIYLTNDAENNFLIDAPGLPVSLGHNETYEFSVFFIPQTTGEKTATLNVQDNLSGKVLHTITLSGNAITEQIYIPVNLNATVTDQDVQLIWANYSGIPGSPGWLHYDDGENYDAIGTGGTGTFDVAIRFDSGTMYGYAGMELTKVKYFPVSANTSYTIKVWTGNDGTLAPSNLVYSQAHTPTVNQWNEVELNTHIPITGTQALWIGYECLVATGADYYPAGCDAGPAVVGYGDLISLGTWESMATAYQLDYNWNLQGYFDIPTGGKAPRLLSIPVINKELPSREHLAVRFTTSGNSNPPTRVLRGFNIFRNNIQINTELVPTTTYLDQGVPYGSYTYTVQGVYYSALSPMSDPVVVNVTPPTPYPLPFVENWSSSSFTTNQWNTTATNWIIDTYNGLEAPSASFSWNPQITNYQEYLTSWYLDATGISNVKFKFDMALNNYSTYAENLLIPQVWDGTTWQTLDIFSSFDNEGDGYAWDTYVYDISAYASNRMFRIRFLAAGEDSYEINYWYIDNIVVEAIPATLPQPTLAIDYDGTNVNLTWDPVPGTDWYLIYAATDPYGTYDYLGYWPASYGTALSFTPNSKEFYQIKACSMELPVIPPTKGYNVFHKKIPKTVANRK